MDHLTYGSKSSTHPAVSYQRECRNCGKKFETRAKKQIYCCQKCAYAARPIKEKATIRQPEHHPMDDMTPNELLHDEKVQSQAYIDMTRRRDWK